MLHSKRALAPLLMLLAVACSADDDPLWEIGDDGHRNLDASACDASFDAPEALRCSAPASAARVALGLCGDLEADNTLRVDMRSYDTDRAPTELAVDGTARIASPLDVGGRFVVLGDLTSTNTIDVSRDLACGSDWSVSSPAKIQGDAFIEGKISASNTVQITNTLHIPSADGLDSVTAGMVSVEPIDVTTALDCAGAIDIGELVAERSRTGASSLRDDALENVDQPSELTLGCGEYVVSGIQANNTLTIRVVGPSTLVVRGDVRIASPVVIEVDRGATFDWLIGGSLQVDNTLTIRSLGGPYATWVGVAGNLRVASPMELEGRLVMPRGDITADNTLDVRGALLARNLRVASPVHVLDGGWLSPTGCAIEPD